MRKELHAYAQALRNLGVGKHAENIAADMQEWVRLSREAQKYFHEQASEALYEAGIAIFREGLAKGIRKYYGSLNPPKANAMITKLKSLGVEDWVPTGVHQAFFRIVRDIAAHPGKPIESHKVKELIEGADKVRRAFKASHASQEGEVAEALIHTLSIGLSDPKLEILAAEFRVTISALYRNAALNATRYQIERLNSLSEADLKTLKGHAAKMNAIGQDLHLDQEELDELD